MIDQDKVIFLDPGGNITALVLESFDRSEYRNINDRLLDEFPEVEQVMFLEESTNGPHGQMAGGEYCANAVRCLGYYLLGGKDGKVTFSTSGVQDKVDVTVEDSLVTTVLPALSQEAIYEIKSGLFRIQFPGIQHIVTETDGTDMMSDRQPARAYLERYASSGQPAAGIMFVEPESQEGCFTITPWVYVRDIDTFIMETGCGSGTAALAATKYLESGFNKITVRQPSGATYQTVVEKTDSSELLITLSGPMRAVNLFAGSQPTKSPFKIAG